MSNGKFYNKKKKAVKAKKGSESDEDSAESSPSHADSEEEEEEEEEEAGEENEAAGSTKDGMADMMSKILNQKTSKVVPVLEKRKTTIMKSIDAERTERAELKKAQAAKSLIRTKQLSQPGHSHPEKERALRKLATKGVVALFNAVAEAQRVQRELDEETAGGSSFTKKEEKAAAMAKVDIKKMSKSNFLDLLTGGQGQGEKKTKTGHASAASREDASEEDEAESDSDGLDPAGSRGRWGALRDDYIPEDEGVLRNWNKDQSDGRAGGGRKGTKAGDAAAGGSDDEGEGGEYLDDVKVRSSSNSNSSSTGKRTISASSPAVKGAFKVSEKKRKHDAKNK